jgi:hypothetical protein
MEEKNTTAIAKADQFSFFNKEQFEQMQRVAKMFVNSELVPDMYRVTENNSLEKAMSNSIIAIDISNRIGANILMVMQNLVIIYGRPSWSSKFLIATINTCGRFEPLKFKFEDLGVLKDYKYKEYESKWVQGANGKKYKKSTLVEKTLAGPIKNIECVAYTTVRGGKDELTGSPVSVEMAINEGWYTKNGSKWPNMTKQMLMYRAASFWTSVYAPELSMGMKTEDEVRDIVDTDYEDMSDTTKEEKKVEAEIKENANKEVIDMDPEPEQKEQPEPEKKAEPQKQFKADF